MMIAYSIVQSFLDRFVDQLLLGLAAIFAVTPLLIVVWILTRDQKK